MTQAMENNYEGVLATLLGSRHAGVEVSNVLDAHRFLEQGIEGAAVSRLARLYKLSNDQMTRLLGVQRRTLHRREKQARLPPGETDRLWRAAVILHKASEILGSREKASNWLQRENRALGGARPLEMLATEAGYAEVRNVLGRIEYGVWS